MTDMRLASTERAPASWLRSFAFGRAPEWDAAARSATAGFDLALFSGGDERVFLNPATNRTKYGTPRGCAESEAWFASSTASAISARGYAAAMAAWHSLVSGRETLESCCESVRQRLTQLFGIDGTQTILTGSGTEAVLVSLGLARMFCGARMTAIIVGCAETGRGVSSAAAGLHFLRQAAFAEVTLGDRLGGLQDLDINVDTVSIRDRIGILRSADEIDAELAAKVEAARRTGRDVIIHRLDVSKTGQSAPTLEAIARLQEGAPGHVFVLADCCQLRCSAEHIKGLLARGFLISLTGSKFAGAPPFAGALLVPPELMQRLTPGLIPMRLPAGLSAYSARLDWPPMLRAMLPVGSFPAANIGLVLRWHAALAEIERFFAWPITLRSAIFAIFHQQVAQRIAEAHCLELLPPAEETEASWGHTILCVAMRHSDGRFLDMTEAAAVQARLREGRDAGNRDAVKRIHLGQPVAVAGAGMLRVCASAALVNHVAEGVTTGMNLEDSFAPTADDIAALFAAFPTAMASSGCSIPKAEKL